MAEKAVARRGASIALACRAFGVSETCYRYGPKLRAENEEIADLLGPFDVHRSRMTVAASEMNALKLSSVLQQRMAMPLYSLSFPKKFSIRCRHL